ncbi:MAG: rRNA maturation RNase YbeY [Ignavibacteria bacterium]|jgi:rRNA maturation RNase YbeY|nr:rRNA maturation RNase YbeY [bacterium]NBP64981.1 rRNA maturation RNase YbeY [Bacteroidota bacterium]GDX64617.1 endoribonuclease YbeY [Chlorobiota bacterium]
MSSRNNKIQVQVFNDSNQKPVPRTKIQEVVRRVFASEGIKEAEVNVIIVTDERIHELNIEFLKHDYPTDVITFPISEDPLEGEVYISADTARNQAVEYGVTLTEEILRLAAHGALHLAGYDDSTPEGKKQMSVLETKYMHAGNSQG